MVSKLSLVLLPALLLVAAIAAAETPLADTVAAMAATSDAGEYAVQRDLAVAQGDAALGDLLRLQQDATDWRARAAAAACEGWIVHADLYLQFDAAAPAPTAAGTMRFRPSDVATDVRLAPLLVERLVWTETDPAARAAVADLMQRIRDPRSVHALGHALLHDTDLVVRMAAADALARIPSDEATSELAAALATVQDADVRTAAAGALGWRKDPAAAPSLLAALTGDDAATCRARAAQSLGWLRDPALAPPLSTALLGDPDPAVRGQAALALGKVGGDHAESALRHAVGSDPDAEVVRLATAALDRL